ncbi:MarR family winged helix-turn-helix transcriptional regulator [Paenibacillus campi]|uniref:MarR family winged helix-turn-helix transcriptional regulator n=1 Tax=Paenibacillus campi TaxID=3106031 RepID=UPI002AFF8ECA|nr:MULTISPECIES: MarR family winged helix-turn-helix transcriptional regulator [unclassified Paenibacillus]
MTKGVPYELEKSIGYKLTIASRLASNRLNQQFRDAGYPVTYEQWILVSYLWKRDGQTQNRLARLSRKDQPSVSRLIDNMIRRGMVIRVPHPDDRRTNLIYLTDYCRSIVDDLAAKAYQTIEEIFKGFSSEEREFTVKMIDRIIKNMD